MSHLTTHLTKRQSRFTLFLTVFLAFVLWLSFPVSMTASPMAVGGTGPGGVGVTTGLDTLELWLQSDKLVYSDSGCTTQQTTDGNPVGCWRDYSGNDNHAVSIVSGEEPTFQNGIGDTLNGYPMLRWDGVNDILRTNNTIDLGVFTVYAVFNATANGLVYEHNTQTNAQGGSYIYTTDSATHSVGRSVSPVVESWRNHSTDWGLGGVTRIVGQAYGGTDATHRFMVNGSEIATTYGNNVNPGTAVLSANLHIGRRYLPNALPITGNYAEFIVYSEALNLAQRTIIENYLQAKYALTITNDRYDGDTNGNGDFDLDVAGIGRATSTEMHTEAHSAGMIVQNDTFLQEDGDYLMFGHLTPTNSNVATDLPGGWGVDARRWERHWYVDVTDVGSITGTVNIIFDFSEAGMGNGSNPVGPLSNYRLLGRSGTSGAFAEIVSSASSISGDQVIFNGVSVSLLGSNFTLGSLDAVTSPTAVQMQSAAATLPTPPWFIIALVLLILGVSAVMIVACGRKA